VVNTGGYGYSLNGTAEDYLHEAALAGHPASGVHYDPAKDGIGLASLGVHEHWNNAAAKLYSRNRGLNEGIELLAVHVNREPPRLTISRTDSCLLLSWPSSQTNYQAQVATNMTAPYQWVPLTVTPALNQAQNIITCLATNTVSVYRLVR
jgi:hypothetical protein